MNLPFLWKHFLNLLLIRAGSCRRSHLVDIFNNLVHQLDIFHILDPPPDEDPTLLPFSLFTRPSRPMSELPQVPRLPNDLHTMKAHSRPPYSLDERQPPVQTNPTNNIVVQIVQGPRTPDSDLPTVPSLTENSTLPNDGSSHPTDDNQEALSSEVGQSMFMFSDTIKSMFMCINTNKTIKDGDIAP